MHQKLIDAGFNQCKSESCLYWKRVDDELVVVGIYADDLLSTAMRRDLAEKAFDDLDDLQIKNLGAASKFLGMRVDGAIVV